MFNNASYRKFSVTGTTNFTFTGVGTTVRMQPAIQAWVPTGATVNQLEPDPGNDGIWFMGYKVTNPSAGVWHYEYALYNQNLDPAIQSFTVFLGPGRTSVTSTFMRRRRSPVGRTTARLTIRVTAVRHGLSLRLPIP